MRRLLLIRHAKSSWKTDAATDHERPLNGRGRRDAPRIGFELSTREMVPQLVLCSDSTRTRETWSRMRTAFNVEPSVVYLPELYHAELDDIIDAISDVPDRYETVAVIGHNPGLEEAVAWLAAGEMRFTTGNVAIFESDLEHWLGFDDAAHWRFVDILRPKELDG